MRSAYHIRELDVFRLLQIHRPLDVFLSHDWPRGIAYHGNKAQLFRAKPFLRQEVTSALCLSLCPNVSRVSCLVASGMISSRPLCFQAWLVMQSYVRDAASTAQRDSVQ